MLVVKVYLWPRGDKRRETLLCQATLDLQGQAQHDVPELGVVEGERRYQVQLLKGTQFGGPGAGADVNPGLLKKSAVWKRGMVRGHRPGGRGRAARGVWDLLGGALKVLLGDRLEPYVEVEDVDPQQNLLNRRT